MSAPENRTVPALCLEVARLECELRLSRAALRGDGARAADDGGPNSSGSPGGAMQTGGWRPQTDRWWPAGGLPDDGLSPPPGHAAAALAAGYPAIAAVAAFGLTAADLGARIALIADVQRRAMNFIPVFLTDCPSHTAFTGEGYAFEYFPRAIYRLPAGTLDPERVNARLRVLAGKWAFTRAMTFSAPADHGEVQALDLPGVGGAGQSGGGQ